MKVKGKVIGGNKLGRKLGFPTANIVVEEDAGIIDGVYAARTEVGGIRYNGMANIGYKPTISGSAAGFAARGDGDAGQHVRLLEVNLFGFEGDLYGKELEVELLKFIRPEKTFSSPDELKTMVDNDRREIEKYFKIR